MLVEHFTGKKECDNIDELMNILDIRNSNKSNEFILTGESDYPYLIITVKENLAVVNYMEEDGISYIALGENNELDPDGTCIFYSNFETEEMEIDNYNVLDIIKAKEIAKEFFYHMELPQNIEWDEL